MSAEYEVEILRRLVSVRSITGNSKAYEEISEMVSEELRSFGLSVEIHDGGSEANDGAARPNIVAFLDKGCGRRLGILTHYDVVPPGEGWSSDPFSLTLRQVEGEVRAYGRGAADDKGCIAAALGALRRISSSRNLAWDIVFMCTADEEIGGRYGAGYIARRKLVNLDALMVLDSSCLGLVVGASGIVHGDIIIRGKSGHAGHIVGSMNAVHRAIVFLGKLLDIAELRSLKISHLGNIKGVRIPRVWGRFSITWIRTQNTTYNVVPGSVTAGFDMRLLPEESVEDALAELEAFFETVKHITGIYDVDLRITRAYPGYYTDEKEDFVLKVRSVIEDVTGRSIDVVGMLGGNDGGWFKDYGIPIVSYGVWDEASNIHGPNESVSLRRIVELRDIIIRLVTE